jgi:hypothetical protein
LLTNEFPQDQTTASGPETRATDQTACLIAEQQEVIAALDRAGVVLKSYLVRHGREDEFGHDAGTLAAVIRTYRDILDSLIV